MAKFGPKPMKFTDEDRLDVKRMTLAGIPQDDIAKIFGIRKETLEKHFRKELDEGGRRADSAVAGALFKNAMSGNVTAQIFWLKCRRRWKEVMGIEGGEKNEPIKVTLHWGKPPNEKT